MTGVGLGVGVGDTADGVIVVVTVWPDAKATEIKIGAPTVVVLGRERTNAA